MSNILTNYQWIDEPEQAANLASVCDDDMFYAIDTEFERSRTYYMNPALLQVCVSDRAYLVDLLDEQVAPVMFRAIKKVILHSGSEDLYLWHQLTGVLPNALFDTQVAAAASGFGLHYSYQNLVKDLLGIELSKAESRSDWLKRPLTDAQIDYAIEDIAYLPELKALLEAKMEANGTRPLFDELMSQQLANVTVDLHAEKVFQKTVKSQRLSVAAQKKLWALLQWREKQAVNRNKPRNWILNPQQLSEMVSKVKSKQDMFQLGLHPNMLRIHADHLLKLLKDSQEIEESQLPVMVKLSSQQGEALTQMKNTLNQRCESLAIEPALIVNVAGLKRLAFENKTLEDLATWRAIQ